MSGFLAVALGGCLIILSIGAAIGLWIWLDARTKGAASDRVFREELDARLAEIERRLTDTQDVMLALSDKVDSWESQRSDTALG